MIRTRTWWRQKSPGFLASCARTLEERFGRDGFSAIVLCGSFAAGDESIVLETDPPILLSDVDLVVVAANRSAHAAWVPRRAELGAACELHLPEARFEGRVDVGILLPSDMRALPPRPGVFDMRATGRVLAGDPRALELIPAYRPADLSAVEAVVLVENRAASLVGFAPEIRSARGEDVYRYLYEIAKVYTDIGAAALVIGGLYRPGYAARSSILAARGPGESIVSRLVDSALAERVASWTRFKLEPSLAGVGASEPEKAWNDAASDLLRFWSRAASYALWGEGALSSEHSARRLAGRISAVPGVRNRLRGWRAFFREHPETGALKMAVALGTRIARSAPLDVVRAHAIALLESRVTEGPGARLAPPAGGFPFRSSAWREAAGELSATWRSMVFGRAEE